MPINNIPGVGPTNADIATAVAAPSAATIAAAVAAPSAATIAAAVAAPSAATIAAAVAAPSAATIAAAVAAPSAATIAAAVAAPSSATITSAVTAAGNSAGWGNSGTTYTVISTTATNTGNTYTLSGLSGYKDYKIVLSNVNVGGAVIGIRINGDTGNNYAHVRNEYSGTAISTSGGNTANFWYIPGTNQTTYSGWLSFPQSNLTGYKTMEADFIGGTNMRVRSIGHWYGGTGATTSILFTTNGTFASGSITLYGVN